MVMKLRFLCDRHRIELSGNPVWAIHCWQNNLDRGQELRGKKLWREAVPHLGCAFETSEIVMTTNAVEPYCARDMFLGSAWLMADTFAAMGEIEPSREVLTMAINRFERELMLRPNDQVSIKNYIGKLYAQIETSNAFATINRVSIAIH